MHLRGCCRGHEIPFHTQGETWDVAELFTISGATAGLPDLAGRPARRDRWVYVSAPGPDYPLLFSP